MKFGLGRLFEDFESERLIEILGSNEFQEL